MCLLPHTLESPNVERALNFGKTLTLAEMRPFWGYTGPVEVKHRLHNLPERLILYQVEVLVEKLNT